MSIPYTREEINLMPNELLLELYKEKSLRLYPYCLIGDTISNARKKMTEWSKTKVDILISGKDGCSMDINTCYWYCNIDENDIIKEIWRAFDYN